MRFLLAAFAVFGVTSALAAELPISGVYGDELGCARLTIGPNDVDEPGGINVYANRLAGYEWGCTFAEVWPYPGGGSHGVQGLCSGEGIPSLQQYIVELNFNDPTQMTVWTADSEVLWRLSLCEAAPGGKG